MKYWFHYRWIRAGCLCLGIFYCTQMRSQTLIPAGKAKITYQLQVASDWSQRVLVAVENMGSPTPVLHFFDQQGREEAPLTFGIPDARGISVNGVGLEPDGTVVLCGIAFDKDGRRGGYISWVPANGQKIKVLNTYPYMPVKLTVGPNGSTWVQGTELV